MPPIAKACQWRAFLPLSGLVSRTSRLADWGGRDRTPSASFSIGFDSEADRSSERNSNRPEDIVGKSGRGIMKNRFRAEAPKYRGLENTGPLENNLCAATKSYGTRMTEARQCSTATAAAPIDARTRHRRGPAAWSPSTSRILATSASASWPKCA